MPATFNAAQVYTLAEMQQFYEPDGSLSTLINMLKQDNPMLEHAKWREGNQTDGHKHKIVTKLPRPAFRRLYKGANYTKSGVAAVHDTCRQIVDRWAVDVDELQMYEGPAAQNAFRMQEGALHVEGMRQFFFEQLIYGNMDVNADEIRGLHARYPYKDAPGVIDAGGTTGDMCSVWGIAWADNNDHRGLTCITPKNMKAGLQHKDLGEFDAFDEDNKPYRALGDEWKWNIGTALGDWRYVVRIANIPVANLGKPVGDADYVDLKDLFIKAKYALCTAARRRVQWYAPNAIMAALEKQASDKDNVHLRYGEYFDSKDVLMVNGRPIFECEGMLETETPLIATPA
jgi:hypothetical protein